MLPPRMTELLHLADRLQAELRSLGEWDNDPSRIPEPKGAFGAETVAFGQWIQVVLLERLRQVAAGDGELPKRSMLAARATREYDGELDRYTALIAILREIDEVVERGRG